MTTSDLRAAAAESGVSDRGDTYCVVGAGGAGLVAAKSLREHGLGVEVLEAHTDVGGNWNFDNPTSRVYESTHLISTKPFTGFPDFPMPDEFPDYPHHSQMLEYFQRYARHFGLYDVIAFSTRVVEAHPAQGGERWDVTVEAAGGRRETRRYAGLIVASGHNWYPKMPVYPGQDGFAGQIIHSADYKRAETLRGKRVLVVGAGNTGCDITVEAAQNAAATFHSVRRGYWYVLKYTMGRPNDQISDLVYALPLPRRAIQWLFETAIKLSAGPPHRHGLRKPDHRILETHPIVNSQLLYYVGHGRITQKPDIDRFRTDEVVFADGTREAVDLVVFATGYLLHVPFLADEHLNWQGDRPHLYRLAFTPAHDNLAVVGLLQPDSGVFTLYHWQAVAIARFLRAQRDDPTVAAAFRERIASHLDDRHDKGVAYAESTRHRFEVNHRAYLEALVDDLALLSQGVR